MDLKFVEEVAKVLTRSVIEKRVGGVELVHHSGET